MSDWLQGNIARSDRALKLRQAAAQKRAAGHEALMQSFDRASAVVDPHLESAIKMQEEEKLYGKEGIRTGYESRLQSERAQDQLDLTTKQGQINAERLMNLWKRTAPPGQMPYETDAQGNITGWKDEAMELWHAYSPAERAAGNAFDRYMKLGPMRDYLTRQLRTFEGVSNVLIPDPNNPGSFLGYQKGKEQEAKKWLASALMQDEVVRETYKIGSQWEAEQAAQSYIDAMGWTEAPVGGVGLEWAHDAEPKEVLRSLRVRKQGRVNPVVENIANEVQSLIGEAYTDITDRAGQIAVVNRIDKLNQDMQGNWQNLGNAQAYLNKARGEITNLISQYRSEEATKGMEFDQETKERMERNENYLTQFATMRDAVSDPTFYEPFQKFLALDEDAFKTIIKNAVARVSKLDTIYGDPMDYFKHFTPYQELEFQKEIKNVLRATWAGK